MENNMTKNYSNKMVKAPQWAVMLEAIIAIICAIASIGCLISCIKAGFETELEYLFFYIDLIVAYVMALIYIIQSGRGIKANASFVIFLITYLVVYVVEIFGGNLVELGRPKLYRALLLACYTMIILAYFLRKNRKTAICLTTMVAVLEMVSAVLRSNRFGDVPFAESATSLEASMGQVAIYARFGLAIILLLVFASHAYKKE